MLSGWIDRGSFAKAYSRAGYEVFGEDIDKATEDYAIMYGACTGHLEDDISECDCIFIALYPQDTVGLPGENAGRIKRGALVADCCGVKRMICERCFTLARKRIPFLSADILWQEYSIRFKYSRGDLFEGAIMLIVPHPAEDMEVIGRLNDF